MVSLYLLWWAGWLVLHTLVLHRLGLSWKDSFTDALVFVFFLALTCGVYATIFRYYQPGAASRLYRIGAAAGMTLLACYAFLYTMRWIASGSPAYLQFVDTSMPLRFGVALVVLSFQAILSYLNAMIAEQDALARHRREVQDLAKEAELAKLRQQLQPHFLFNSLNSISALAGTNAAQAREMIQQLSDFLRGTLRRDEGLSIPLSEELRHLDLYLQIERVRFGHRLRVEQRVGEGCAERAVPPLLLQPVAENAIKYGLYGTTEEVLITIDISCEKDGLRISVKNPFTPEGSPAAGTGFGLKSLARRLQLIYGRTDLLQIRKQDGIFETALHIPS